MAAVVVVVVVAVVVVEEVVVVVVVRYTFIIACGCHRPSPTSIIRQFQVHCY